MRGSQGLGFCLTSVLLLPSASSALGRPSPKKIQVAGLHGSMLRITRDDPVVNEAFRVQLVDWYLHRVYDELAGPLSDDIAPIPGS